MINGTTTAMLYMDSGASGLYRADIPLVRSQGIDDPENFTYLVAQVSWLATVAQNMNSQLVGAAKIVNTLYPTADAAAAVKKIDLAQSQLGSTSAVPEEPFPLDETDEP